MTRFFGGPSPDSKLATRAANALVAQYGGYCAFEEARRRCRDPKLAFQHEAGHWERVTDILARRTGRSNGSLVFELEIPQNTCFVAVGEPVEVTFKTYPGKVYAGRVEAVLGATAHAQSGGLAVVPPDIQSASFLVRIKLDDQDVAKRLSAGSTELAVIFTDHDKASHVIRRVVLRQAAILNYVN